MIISNLVAKILMLLLVAVLAWGTAVALVAFWIFGASLTAAWIVGLSMAGGFAVCIAALGWEFYQSIDPSQLQDDEGNEFLDAILLRRTDPGAA